MHIIKGSRAAAAAALHDAVVTLGNFDGVHLGHQKILGKTIQRARAIRGVSVIYTFEPHPLCVLRPESAPRKITTFEEKSHIFAGLGIDYLIIERFTRAFAAKPPEAFIKNVLCSRLRARELVIGHDYMFGNNRAGSIPLLQQMGAHLGYRVHVVSDLKIKNIPVRSTTLRRLIAAGKVSLAAKLMGRPYSLFGRVVHGKRRRIGFPTANLRPAKKDLIPGNGVYAIRCQTPQGLYDGVVSIGHNPTFGLDRLCIEAHLFGFHAELYGEEITLTFVKRIRGEKKFKDVPSLVSQIERDVAFARRVLKAR